ncbi:MAG: penicillin-binding protein [Nocardioidaceae bacterium]|nr:penicillin-binding protein [Nocardioidaceae bacterium]MCL2612751.1 penicillin-binding protein [Nocardioidaceae bacterium]
MGALVAIGGFIVAYKSIDIPDPNAAYLTQTTHVYFANGKSEIGDFAVQDRDAISYADMPQTMKDAVVAAENRSFWTDHGIDPRGILRAAFSDAQGNATQGGSTITQQYVKLLYLSQERTWKRKIKEAILSLKIQQQLSKQKILEGYLNTVYFGRGAYGIQAAAHAYFNVDAKHLNLRQSAVLASLVNDPNGLDPSGGKDARAALLARYNYVLSGMVSMGTADPGKADKAEGHLPKFPKQKASDRLGDQRGFLLTMVKQQLLDLGFSEQEIDGGGLKVTTTFNRKDMRDEEQGVKAVRPQGFGPRRLHVAAATVQPGTGAVRGFYAGQDYLLSQLNWAELGGQAGSTFKPFALAAALKSGWSLKDTFDGNAPYTYPDGTQVTNEQHTSYGAHVSLLTALEQSINTAFANMTVVTPNGPQRIVKMANAMGVPPAKPANPAYGFPDHTPGQEANMGVALGSETVSPINMANAYATIANKGVAADPYIIEKVVDAKGVVRYHHEVTTHRAVGPKIAADVSYAMQQVVQKGTGTAALALGRPAAGKTGTATNGLNQVSSAWFAGFTPQLSTAVMYVRGQGNGRLDGWLPSYFGSAYPAHTWLAIMQKEMAGLPIESFPPPAWVTGTPPVAGHAPVVPKPTKTTAPKPTKTTSSAAAQQTTTAASSPSATATTSAPPTDPCTQALAPPSCQPSPGAGNQGGAGGGGNNGANGNPPGTHP